MGEAINQLTALKHFDMCLDNLFEYVFKIPQKYAVMVGEKTLAASLDGVIPGLKHLSFCFQTSKFEHQIVSHLGAQCTSLRLHRVNMRNHKALQKQLLDHSIELTHLQLSQHFDSLSVRQCFVQLCTLELIYCSRKYFPHVYTGPDMASLLSLLVPLKQLTALILMGFEIESFGSEIVLPVLSRITRLSINAGNRVLKNQNVWFYGLSRVFPAVRHLTLAFDLNYSIDLCTHISRNFVQCTHFRLLYLHYKNMNHTLPSALARHHQRRFRRQYDHGVCIDLWSEEDEHEAEQQWTRRCTEEEWIKF